MTATTSKYGRSLTGRSVLVTGAGSGIGTATASALGAAGAHVLVHARTAKAAADAVRRLADASGSFTPVAGDLGSLDGTRSLAARVAERAPDGLHVLVNNAGAAFSEHGLSPDGIERTIAVNHVAVAALTDALLDSLRAAAEQDGRPSRVVNLSSVVEKRGNPIDDWRYPAAYKQLQAYSDSKLINLAYTLTLADRLRGTGVTVNAANPGSVATGFGAKAGGTLKLIMIAGKPFMANPAKGARTSVRLAADPALDGETSGYYSNGKSARPSAKATDPSTGQRIYEQTHAFLATRQA